ncbi:MAG: hypothetical protein NUV57_03830 [archaeon]|nr:hypothetical protein [archaeon]
MAIKNRMKSAIGGVKKAVTRTGASIKKAVGIKPYNPERRKFLKTMAVRAVGVAGVAGVGVAVSRNIGGITRASKKLTSILSKPGPPEPKFEEYLNARKKEEASEEIARARRNAEMQADKSIRGRTIALEKEYYPKIYEKELADTLDVARTLFHDPKYHLTSEQVKAVETIAREKAQNMATSKIYSR